MANLTGVALADAMENYMLRFATPIKRGKKDWMGNMIKVGDTVVVYRTRHFIRGDIEKWNPQTKEFEFCFNIPDDPIWEKQGEYEIIDYGGGGAYYNVTPNSEYGSLFMELNEASFMGQDYDIVCIKGISDCQALYYKHLEEKK